MYLMTKRVQASSRLLASLTNYGRLGYPLMAFSTSNPNDKAEEGGKSQFEQIKQRQQRRTQGGGDREHRRGGEDDMSDGR